MQDTVAIALIAVGGTIGSACLSYLSTRRTTKTQLKAAKDSTSAQLGSLQLEVRKLEAAQDAELRSARQRLYQEYLNAAYALRDFMTGLSSAADGPAFDTAGQAFRQREVEIELLASARVKERTEALYDLLIGVIDEAFESSDGDFDEQLNAAFTAKEPQWRLMRNALVRAMRSELAPSQ